MKKLLLTFSLMLGLVASYAQGNLQFNRVVLVEINYVLPNGNLYQYTEQTITVPAGKVWKIEAAYGTYQSNVQTNPSFSAGPQILINNKLIHHSTSSSSVTTAWYNYLPMWLPEGSYTLKMVSANGSTQGNQVYGGISGIEFNVVP